LENAFFAWRCLTKPDTAKEGLVYLRAGRSSSRPPRMAVEQSREVSRRLLMNPL
jgi:hypothetical protein